MIFSSGAVATAMDLYKEDCSFNFSYQELISCESTADELYESGIRVVSDGGDRIFNEDAGDYKTIGISGTYNDSHQKLIKRTEHTKNMNSKKLLNRLVIILVSAGIVSIGFNVFGNIEINKAFNQRENAYPYKQAASKNNIDLLELKWIFQDVIGLGGGNYVQEIASPVTISYYESANALTPVYKIEKGTKIYFDSEEEFGYELSEYRGTDSLPTHRYGWRLAKPFKVVEERGLREDFLYVKLSDLEEITEAWIEANPILMQSKTKQELVEFQTLNRDLSLYQEGIYLSPDLKNPVLSNFTYMMFVLSFVGGLTNLCLRRFNTKK